MSIAASDESEPSTSSSVQRSQLWRHFEFGEILSATNNFDESLVIGRGGFAKVYKGNINNGPALVVAAIKRLDVMSNQGPSEFWAEIEMISKLRHCHLVSLIGYCNYETELILVYEYMPNGTLEDHLHKLGTHLSWCQRLKICIGAARGLDYLHTGTGIEFGIIHRDVKSSNILLDESWAAKVSDFGLSKISPQNQPWSHVSTLVKGTFGYFDPNYYATGKLTRKSDVYGFGVVLLEVLCRKRAVDKSLEWGLATWAQDSIKEGHLEDIVDARIRGEISPEYLKQYARIAERCLDNHPKHRPTMGEVVLSLENMLALQERDDGKKALDELKQLVQEALKKHEFIAPPTPEEKVAGTDEKATNVTKEDASPEKEVTIWGIPLLRDQRSDVVLLKFLRARDFKVKDAFTMLKNVLLWRKEFNIESLLEEDLGTEQEEVVYMHGVDKEGHPICYNASGEYQNKELYNKTFSTEEKRTKYLRWRIQFLEKSIRKLDFSPDGICTIVQVIDCKNSRVESKREFRQATNQVFQLFQDNYPEFIAKQVFINVPFLYLGFYKLINPFFTQRTKSKFVFAGPSKTAETLFKYIAPEVVPVQYGGLSRIGEQEFTSSDSVTEEVIKPVTKHTIEIPAPEACTLVWEARVMGYEVRYGAEFVPLAADSYTVIIQKSRKLATTDEPLICEQLKCYEPGKVVLTFDNQTTKKKKVMYRSKTKETESIIN